MELQAFCTQKACNSKHLLQTYGDMAFEVAEIAKNGYGKKVVDDYTYIEAEIVWAVENEMAQNFIDILFRRLRLFFLNQEKAKEALERAVYIVEKLPGYENLDLRALAKEAENRFENDI